MGHHYTPKAHLKRFEIEEKSDHVWMYDKTRRTFKALPIDAVAQEPGYYPDDIEIKLNFDVEIPGNSCVEKLLRKENLTPDERESMSAYLVNMRTRGPRQRKQSNLTARKLLPETINEARQALSELETESVGQCEDMKKIKILQTQLEVLEQRCAYEPLQFIDRLVRTPFNSDNTTLGIFEMCWEIVPCANSMFFITSDTPAHFFEGLGIGRDGSEFTFPLSKNFALVGHNRGSKGSTRFHSRSLPRTTKEINRRVISTTERFVFGPSKKDWIETLAQKDDHYLNEMRW